MSEETSYMKTGRMGKIVSDVEETDKITTLYRKHKLRLLKAKYHYSSLNYSKLLSTEILSHEGQQNVDEKKFFKNTTLTRENLAGIINLNLKKPIEAYLVLKKPLTVSEIIKDVEILGEVLFKNSSVDFCKDKGRIKKFLGRMNHQDVVLNQLAILKAESPDKYCDMLRTGILNYVIESRFTNVDFVLEESFLSGVLHDLGFLYLDPRYLDSQSKPFSIKDLKTIQNHTYLGYHILKPWFPENIINAAMTHHIGEDNSGYPRQIGVKPNRIAKLTGFASSFVACLRKHKLEKALKLQEIYSREQSHAGDKLKPVFKREFYQILESLEIQDNTTGNDHQPGYNRKYSVILHNFLVYIYDLGRELAGIDTELLNYIRDKAAHRLDLQDDIDDVFDHIKKLKVIINSSGKSPGLRRIMNDGFLASGILGDIEIISMELHRNNRFFIGLFSYLNSKLKDITFESTVYKKARGFSSNIKRNISDQVEKQISVFDLLNAISG